MAQRRGVWAQSTHRVDHALSESAILNAPQRFTHLPQIAASSSASVKSSPSDSSATLAGVSGGVDELLASKRDFASSSVRKSCFEGEETLPVPFDIHVDSSLTLARHDQRNCVSDSTVGA